MNSLHFISRNERHLKVRQNHSQHVPIVIHKRVSRPAQRNLIIFVVCQLLRYLRRNSIKSEIPSLNAVIAHLDSAAMCGPVLDVGTTLVIENWVSRGSTRCVS